MSIIIPKSLDKVLIDGIEGRILSIKNNFATVLLYLENKSIKKEIHVRLFTKPIKKIFETKIIWVF